MWGRWRQFWSNSAAARLDAAWTVVRAVHGTWPTLRSLPDGRLRDRYADLREVVARGAALTDWNTLSRCFAVTAEALRRVTGRELYPVQLLAGVILTSGGIAEMQTGEGKTITAALPATAHALIGRGVHVVTSNAYLAERDQRELAPVYELLGLHSALLPERVADAEKRRAYQADITYGTGYEFGFDYLRDQLKLAPSNAPRRLGTRIAGTLQGTSPWTPLLQRGLHFAVVDEVDHVLLDDAASPLLLSLPTAQFAADIQAHQLAKTLADQLEQSVDYELDHYHQRVELTAAGRKKAHAQDLEVPFEILQRPWLEYVEAAVRANYLLRRDVHYVVANNELQLVDQATGRIFADRAWQQGLHQAVECREGLPITAEKRAAATITRQRFFRLYRHLSGMTGTAQGSEREFRDIYHLEVTSIPTHRPSRRQILAPVLSGSLTEKFAAIVTEALHTQSTGQPVMIGTRTIEDSERLADALASRGVAFQLLNGRQDANEAELVAQAGKLGMITIATNLAGRGTDILPDPAAIDRGGLHVIATERADSARVDRQLFGRSGRQGEPGSARFHLSPHDWLMRLAARTERSSLGADAVHDSVASLEHHSVDVEPGSTRRLSGLPRLTERIQRVWESLQTRQRRQILARDEAHAEFMSRATVAGTL